jgi:plasmid stabilization system protein ParE
VRVTYRSAARDDLIRQFRYYAVDLNRQDLATHFREAVRKTIRALSLQPAIAPRYDLHNSQLRNLRSWPVADFAAIRIYFVVDHDSMRVIRILHGKRDVRSLLDREDPSADPRL